jgi:dTMP kinase
LRPIKGIFITFEGPEGSGKSTVLAAVKQELVRRRVPVALLREPGGTAISEKIREILLDRAHGRMTAPTELFLYLAARAQITEELIRPVLEKRGVVFCDRYHDSTVAYQGYGGGIPLRLIDAFGRFAKGGLEPDLTLVFDVETETGLKRAGRADRMEQKSLEFHRRVRRGFLALARRNRKRMTVVRDERDVRVKTEKVRTLICDFLKKRGVL